MFVYTILTEGAPTLRFLQGWAAILHVVDRARPTAWIKPLSAAFPTPAPSTSSGQALRAVLEGPATPPFRVVTREETPYRLYIQTGACFLI